MPIGGDQPQPCQHVGSLGDLDPKNPKSPENLRTRRHLRTPRHLKAPISLLTLLS